MNRYVKTKFPIAYESPDHLIPWGTKRDLSRQLRFESKLITYMQHKNYSSILDLGCSGGAFICNMHNLGFLAFGLEGSDYSKINRRGPWAYLANHVLFTADITKDFEISVSNEKSAQVFEIITSFEVLEHLKEDQLETLFKNIKSCSGENTRLIFSVSMDDDIIDGINLHQTVKPRKWWISKFENFGWVECKPSMQYFNGQYLRGERFGAGSSFEVVLRKPGCKDINVPKLSFFGRILDMNSGSKFQRLLFKLVHGDSVYNSY